MIITICAIALSLLLFFNPLEIEHTLNSSTLSIILALIGTFFLFIPTLARLIAWTPLQNAEQNLTPRVLDMWRKDKKLRIFNLWLFLFPLITFALAFALPNVSVFSQKVLLSVWVLLAGIALDGIQQVLRSTMRYMNPFMVIELLTQEGKESVMEKRETDLLGTLDSLSEVGVKSIARSNSSLCNQALDAMLDIMREFINQAKKRSVDAKMKGIESNGQDKVSYTLFYFFQRLEQNFDLALAGKLEPICSNIISILGKTAIAVAPYDMSMVEYPVHFMGKLAAKAQTHGQQEVGIKAEITLPEIAKIIVTENDINPVNIKAPILSIVRYLHELTKETFRQDKQLNLQVLVQPFRDLRDLFTSEGIGNHPDSPIIAQDLGNVIAEFDALEAVLKTMPPMPKIEVEK